MDGFEPAVDGYVDVADQLSRYLLARADEAFAAGRESKASLSSAREFEARRDRVRERFLDAIGGLPPRPEDPPVERTGRLDRDGHSIELLTVESRPDFHVTANCYVPDGDGPHPGVLFLCGHVDTAKADPMNQRAAAELALNGFVVLVVDPIAQGERLQYTDPDTGEALVAGGGGVFAHCYAGQQCLYAGTNLARWMVHDARCGLACLLNRPDVDGDRLAVTGTSGGGIQTLYLALVDDRVDAAAPCCSVTTREEWLGTGKRVDAEQLIPGAIPAGIDYDDFVTAIAPRPVCVGAARWDQYFPVEGVHETLERARRVYDLYDAPGNLDCVLADETHCSVYELGDGVFEWLCDTLGDGAFESHGSLPVLDEEKLHCTPEGSVRAAHDDERTVDDLLRDHVAERHPDANEGTPSQSRDVDPDAVRRALADRFALDRDDCDLHPRYVARGETDGLTVERVWFRSERHPDIVVTGVLVSAVEDPNDPEETADTEAPAVVLYEEGTGELPDRSEDVAALAREHGAALVFDPRGVGAVRNRHVPIPTWQDDYFGVYGTEFKLAYDALFLGESLFGMRAYDTLRAVEFLGEATGAERVSFVGEGVGAYHALYAAAVARDVARVEVRDLGPSFAEMATSREYPYDPRLTVFDVVGSCDVPRVLAALRHRGVRVDHSDKS